MTENAGLSGIVDGHMHQWDPLATPRVASAPAKVVRRAPFLSAPLFRTFPRATRDFVGDPRYLLNPYLPLDYAADSAAAHVDTVVHIQAGWQGRSPMDAVDETRWVAALPFGIGTAPRLGAIVVHANPAERSIGAVLDGHMRASTLVRGVRCIAAFGSDRGVMDFAERDGLLCVSDFLRDFAEIADRGLSFDIWLYAHQLRQALPLVSEYPETTFILDHYATPAGALGPLGNGVGAAPAERRVIVDRWRDDIAALADRPNVVAKHSGFGMPVLGLGRVSREHLRDAIGPLTEHVEDVFGPQRTFWSSNFPIDKPGVTLADSVWILRQVLGDRLDDEAMFRGNVCRVYRIDP